MLPVIPSNLNKLISDNQGRISTYPFPPNLAVDMPEEIQHDVFLWMLQNYIWPQLQDRQPYEQQWNDLYDMAHAMWSSERLDLDEAERARMARLHGERSDDETPIAKKHDITDTVIFDAVDRLTNLNHFVSFKEDLPVRYERPADIVYTNENEVYHPSADVVKAANALLKWNSDNHEVYRNHWIAARHFYTYGCVFAVSEFETKIEKILRRQEGGQFAETMELTKIGTTFEPLSIRKLWLDPRISAYNMDYQPCPFFYDFVPRFHLQGNPYDPTLAPFGFANLQRLQSSQYLFGPETEAITKAFAARNSKSNLNSLIPPELSVELLWTFYAMLPLSEDGKQFDPNNIPFKRYIVQAFGSSLAVGSVSFVRIQRNYYPHDSIPLYGSAHMPELESGTYSCSIGSVLKSHYVQICTALAQHEENKNWINDPPTEVMTGSPALNQDLNKKGAKIEVTSPNDIRRREPFDSTGTTVQFINDRRGQAQNSSKAVDAILGKAMGSRTSATEASNAFQAAMSGVTTDINMFNRDIAGGYVTRQWEYAGLWMEPDVLKAITGQYGFALKPEHMILRLGLKYDIGSTYIESIVRQGNLRYILEASKFATVINQAPLWKMLLEEWKFPNADLIINDGGHDQQVKLATEQAIRTFLGEQVFVSPDQNHEIALKVKVSFLEDSDSVWMSNPKTNVFAQALIQQIQMHQQFIQIMMQQQLLQQQMQFAQAQEQDLQPLQNGQGQAQLSAPPPTVQQAGQVAQQRS